MNLDIYLQKSSNIFAENRLLKFSVVILGVAVVINTVGVFKALNSQKIILVPPVINSKISVTGDKASDEYLKEFTRYALGLALTYNPSNARPQFSELLALYDPSAFQAARKDLYMLADKIESTHAASAFYINSVSHDAEKQQLQVTGSKQTYMTGEKASDFCHRRILATDLIFDYNHPTLSDRCLTFFTKLSVSQGSHKCLIRRKSPTRRESCMT